MDNVAIRVHFTARSSQLCLPVRILRLRWPRAGIEACLSGAAASRRGGTYGCLKTLLKHKLLHHDASKYDGFRLTYLGYDFLALRVRLSPAPHCPALCPPARASLFVYLPTCRRRRLWRGALWRLLAGRLA